MAKTSATASTASMAIYAQTPFPPSVNPPLYLDSFEASVRERGGAEQEGERERGQRERERERNSVAKRSISAKMSWCERGGRFEVPMLETLYTSKRDTGQNQSQIRASACTHPTRQRFVQKRLQQLQPIESTTVTAFDYIILFIGYEMSAFWCGFVFSQTGWQVQILCVCVCVCVCV